MIHEYLLELRRALGRRLPPAVLSARLREAEGHLRQAAEEFGEAEAVRRYGSAPNAAQGIVRAYRGYASASPWRLTLGVGLLLFLSTAIPNLWLNVLLRDAQPIGPSVDLAFRWAPFLAVIAFGLRAAQTRRWLVLPGVAWLVTAVVCSFAVQFVVPPFPTGEKARLAYERTVRHYDSQLALVEAWRRGEPSTREAPLYGPVTEVRNVPSTPLRFSKAAEPMLMLGPVASPAEARELWRRNGASWATLVTKQRNDAVQGVWRSVGPGQIIVALPNLAVPLLWTTLSSLFGLTVVNASALGLAALTDRRWVRTRRV